MKRLSVWVLMGLVVSLVLGAHPVQAAVEQGPARKLSRGVANLGTGWLELLAQMTRSVEEVGGFSGIPLGIVRGLVWGTGRTLVGALELVTFPIPNPTTGYGPVIEPEFVTFRDADRW